jgi:superfamily II DNA or RNA helicase
MASTQFLRSGHIIRARGQSWIVHRHVAGTDGSVLEVRGRGVENRGERTTFLLPYEPIERLPSSGTPRIVRPGTWRRLVRPMLAGATPSYDALRSPARAALAVLPFQLEPVLAVVRGLAARILIADEVGLGKTIQAGLIISELLERRSDARILVVTPAGLREQWQTELRQRFARESTLLDSASVAQHAAEWNGNPWSVPGIVLTSLDYVKRPEVVRAVEALIWDVVVFDEAHGLAGRSDRATAAALLARRARTLVLLTATPHSGDDDAFTRLTSLGDFANRSPLPDASARQAFPLMVFRRTRRDIGMASARRTLSLRVRPSKNELEMHAALLAYARVVWKQTRLAVTMLTRRACSSAWSLARSLETRLRLLGGSDQPDLPQMPLPFADPVAEDDAPGVELSAPGLSDRDEERRWLEHVLRLARLAEPAESKLRALRRLLRRAREPAIVFTEYRDTLRQVAHHLDDFSPAQLHGGMTAGERHDVLRRFVSGEVPLLLATDAASEGLNLHHRCRLVINLELPWTPVRLEQRIGRVERLGQQRRVHAVHLLAANTCEEESVAVLLDRMRRVADVLGGMRAAAYEEEIASAAIGDDSSRADLNCSFQDNALEARPLLPPGIVIGDLRSAASDEAARLEYIRRFASPGAAESVENRPVVTVLTGTRRRFMHHWVYQLIFEEPDLQPIWTTLIGIRQDQHLLEPSHDAIRQGVRSLSSAIAPVLTPTLQGLLARFQAALHQSRSLAAARERAIAHGVRQQRARLATSLVQPGLFDRRAERAAAAQNATLDAVLERCRQRLAELDRLQTVSVDRRLVFGVVRRSPVSAAALSVVRSHAMCCRQCPRPRRFRRRLLRHLHRGRGASKPHLGRRRACGPSRTSRCFRC